MAKPTEDPTWAESGSPVEPSAKRTNGYVVKDKLPAQEFNWLIRALSRWIVWLGALFSNSGGLTQGVAGGSLNASTDGSVRDLDHAEDGDVTFLSSTHLRARGSVYVGQTTIGGVVGAEFEELSSQDFDAAVVQLRSVDVGTKSGGLMTGAYTVTDATPGNDDQATLQSRISSLYLRNLPKLVASLDLVFDGSGNLSTATVGAGGPHNAGALAVETGTVPDQLELTPLEAFTPAALVATIVDASITSPQMSVALLRLTGPTRIGVRVYYWTGSGWGDALAGNATLANVTVSIGLIAF